MRGYLQKGCPRSLNGKAAIFYLTDKSDFALMSPDSMAVIFSLLRLTNVLRWRRHFRGRHLAGFFHEPGKSAPWKTDNPKEAYHANQKKMAK
jgi:hypothetical protein